MTLNQYHPFCIDVRVEMSGEPSRHRRSILVLAGTQESAIGQQFLAPPNSGFQLISMTQLAGY